MTLIIAEAGLNHNGDISSAHKLVDATVDSGAKVIEKHITLDNKMKGPDHQVSLEPNSFKEMVRCIRNIEISFGDVVKKPSECKIKNLQIVRKSLIAKNNIKKGDLFTEENLNTKRLGNGINPMQWQKKIGIFSFKEFREDEVIFL